MKAEKQYKESLSRTVQTKQGGNIFVDNRPQSIDQTRMIDSVQKKQNKIRLSHNPNNILYSSKDHIQMQYDLSSHIQLGKEAQMKNKTIQMYEMLGDSKISINRKLLLDNPYTLYAGDEQFDQANAIADCNFLFNKGETHQKTPGLSKVIPEIKNDSELYVALLTYKPESDKQWLVERLEDQSGSYEKFSDYLVNDEKLKDRTLTPSDCRAMAYYVAGFDLNDGIETDEIEPGMGYEFLPEDSSKAEWTSHYAAIIMTDEEDHVTMENSAAKMSDEFSKLQYDHGWFFDMYSDQEGQTFYDKYYPFLGEPHRR